MIYVTTRQKVEEKQITWMDIISGVSNVDLGTNGTPGTITHCYEELPERFKNSIYVDDMIDILEKFNETHKSLFEKDRKTLYRHFSVPKKTGGLRPIDAPCDELQNALNELRIILTEKFGVLYHTAAYAYITGRSTYQEVHKHQVNKSNWFLKTDFSGFFPSTTLEFTMKMLSMVFPLSEICKVERGYKALEKAISLAFLNGGLPQGTVVSPTLTNILSIPMDHRIFNDLAHKHMVYTRYADDIHISCVQKFDKDKMVKYIESVLKEFGAPWKIKPEKTLFGTNKACSANWLLGLCLNKDNNITVGWRRKDAFKAATSNLMMDYKHGKSWNIDDIQYYRGNLSYYMSIEKDYFKKVIERLENKYHVKLKKILKEWRSVGKVTNINNQPVGDPWINF